MLRDSMSYPQNLLDKFPQKILYSLSSEDASRLIPEDSVRKAPMKSCPSCGSPNEPEADFCYFCEQKFAGEEVPPVREPAPEPVPTESPAAEAKTAPPTDEARTASRIC